MKALYLILILVSILLIWLGIQKRWKALLLTLLSFIVLLASCWFLFLHITSLVLTPTCEDNRIWRIEEYVIIEKRCIGFVGPFYYPVYLYRDGKELDHLSYMADSACMVQFELEKGDTLTFDLCEKEMR